MRAKIGSKKLYGGRKKSILQRQAVWHQWRKRIKKKERNHKLLLHCQSNQQTKTNPEKTWPEENQETNQPQSKSHGNIQQGRRKQQLQPSQRNWKAQTEKEEANQLQSSKSESNKNLRKSRRAQQRWTKWSSEETELRGVAAAIREGMDKQCKHLIREFGFAANTQLYPIVNAATYHGQMSA